MTNRLCIALLAAALTTQAVDAQQPPRRDGSRLWIDPAWSNGTPGRGTPRMMLWFDNQLLPGGDAYAVQTRVLAGARRRALRVQIVDSLKALHEASWKRAGPAIQRLETAGVLADCERHWIVNSVSCDLPSGDVTALGAIPGASHVYRVTPRAASVATAGPVPTAGCVKPVDDYRPDPARTSWNVRALGVDRVWSEYGLTGRGVLQVVHDFGWTLAAPTIQATLWCNAREVPGNGVDDDGNGYIDDVHGFNFDRRDASIIGGNVLDGGLTHGDLTAALLAGRDIVDTALVIGMAPGSRWAAVQSSGDIAAGVEWALTVGADTYSMSFSIPALGELRGHWRRVLEHGALAGLFFVSGAGNFAMEGSPSYAPVPVQMRIPEDVPLAVLGMAGVGRDGSRPPFSSQGPVDWSTVDYSEGKVNKPDLATINTNILAIDSAGRAHYRGVNGWSGNSFAGPHMAGVIALMLEANPDLTPWEAREILVTTARDIGAPGEDAQSGAGMVDAYRAVGQVRAPSAQPRLFQRVSDSLSAMESALSAVRRDLHQHPELSLQEKRTSGVVADYLNTLGLEVRTGVGGYGVVGILRGGMPGPVVAYRADMDAVPSRDADPVEFRSVVPGVRHICGHDIHTTVGLGLAAGLASVRAELSGTVVFVFEPAEENVAGARAMLADGVFTTKPDAIFAIHTAPLAVGQLGTIAGTMMAWRDRATVRLTGTGDLVRAADSVAGLIRSVGTVPLSLGAVPRGAGFILAQLASNTAGAGQRTLVGSISVADDASSDRARAQIAQLVGRMSLPDVAVAVEYEKRWIPGVTNDVQLTQTATASVRRVFGEAAVQNLSTISPAFSEDYGAFQAVVPGAFFYLGVGPDGMPHSPGYVADEAAIVFGARSMAAAILDRLGHPVPIR